MKFKLSVGAQWPAPSSGGGARRNRALVQLEVWPSPSVRGVAGNQVVGSTTGSGGRSIATGSDGGRVEVRPGCSSSVMHQIKCSERKKHHLNLLMLGAGLVEGEDVQEGGLVGEVGHEGLQAVGKNVISSRPLQDRPE